MNVQTVTADVLVIGSGGAALRAALAAQEAGAEVLVASKGAVGKSGATYFSVAELGAFNVPDGAIDPTDNPDAFFHDIMDAAQGMADPKLARIVADEAIEAKDYLESLGMQYARREDGGYMGYRACFSQKARSHVVENHFKPIVRVLREETARRGIRTMEGVTITNLVVRDGVCAGAVGLCGGELLAVDCGAVIIACGGASTLFAHNMYPADVTGDGYAMACRAGAKLSNMEFVQAGIGLAWPAVNLFGNQLWEAAPKLTNGDHRRFLSHYIQGDYTEEEVVAAKGGHFPFSVRDISRFVEIAVQQEITRGTPTARGNVYLDFLDVDFEALFSRPNSQLKPMWPLTYQRFQELGVDLYREKIEIACFAHAINGGIRIDENGESTVPGLYAAGEAASGPHGADRLGGNMSVTCQVFGKRAGIAAAQHARRSRTAGVTAGDIAREQAYLGAFGRLSQAEADSLRAQLQSASDAALLIVRDGPVLEAYLHTLSDLEARLHTGTAADPVPVERVLELQNLIDTGRMIAASALARRESRGSHYRRDYPQTNPAFGEMLTI
ncbi:FAD-binding protein [uncultured Oscillibacter sp.]|uniref:FAD-binding protein n=1 Tax=uncultured Oscillibacter sp. TaxID=876091 RepID=UPI0025E59BDD|nr:FAD-binding protein [uncultured Oscillibacter sp.]